LVLDLGIVVSRRAFIEEINIKRKIDGPKHIHIIKYRLLNIFYNREPEIEYLSCLIEEEKTMKQISRREYKSWIKEAKNLFHKFVRDLELERRRENKNLVQRDYHEALNNFKCLKRESDSFMISVRKRLARI
jgi:hypothetical protein